MTDSHHKKGQCPKCGGEEVIVLPEEGILRGRELYPDHKLVYRIRCRNCKPVVEWFEQYLQKYHKAYDLDGVEITETEE